MPKSLTKTQIAQYEEEGYLAPISVMAEQEALALRQKLEAIEAEMGGPLRGDLRHKTHLLFPFLAELVLHRRILDAIEDVLGPDILCWSSNFFIKEAADPAFVSWHQDSTYWGLSSPDVATARVAPWRSSPAATSSTRYRTATPSTATIFCPAARRSRSRSMSRSRCRSTCA